MICPVKEIDEDLAERWVADFDSWDVCEQVMSLFAYSEFGWKKAVQWCDRPEEFVKRTGFAMFCWFAVHDKQASDSKFVRVKLFVKNDFMLNYLRVDGMLRVQRVAHPTEDGYVLRCGLILRCKIGRNT